MFYPLKVTIRMSDKKQDMNYLFIFVQACAKATVILRGPAKLMKTTNDRFVSLVILAPSLGNCNQD